MAPRRTEDQNRDEARTGARDGRLVDAEALRSCFDEGCDLAVDADGRIHAARDREGARDSLQILSKLRRWYGR